MNNRIYHVRKLLLPNQDATDFRKLCHYSRRKTGVKRPTYSYSEIKEQPSSRLSLSDSFLQYSSQFFCDICFLVFPVLFSGCFRQKDGSQRGIHQKIFTTIKNGCQIGSLAYWWPRIELEGRGCV